jgi:hypothetical protein
MLEISYQLRPPEFILNSDIEHACRGSFHQDQNCKHFMPTYPVTVVGTSSRTSDIANTAVPAIRHNDTLGGSCWDIHACGSSIRSSTVVVYTQANSPGKFASAGAPWLPTTIIRTSHSCSSVLKVITINYLSCASRLCACTLTFKVIVCEAWTLETKSNSAETAVVIEMRMLTKLFLKKWESSEDGE